jgi:hypothetical protein
MPWDRNLGVTARYLRRLETVFCISHYAPIIGVQRLRCSILSLVTQDSLSGQLIAGSRDGQDT